MVHYLVDFNFYFISLAGALTFYCLSCNISKGFSSSSSSSILHIRSTTSYLPYTVFLQLYSSSGMPTSSVSSSSGTAFNTVYLSFTGEFSLLNSIGARSKTLDVIVVSLFLYDVPSTI